MFTQRMLDEAVREAYEWAHAYCGYASTDRSFPVGNDGRMDCTGLMLRALYTLRCVSGPLNCDEIDALMPSFGFVKSTDINDVYRHHGFVQWCYPHVVGTEHINHTYYSLGGDGRTISKYDTGSDPRIQSAQPLVGVPVDEWGGALVFKYIWFLPEPDEPAPRDESGTFLRVGE